MMSWEWLLFTDILNDLSSAALATGLVVRRGAELTPRAEIYPPRPMRTWFTLSVALQSCKSGDMAYA